MYFDAIIFLQSLEYIFLPMYRVSVRRANQTNDYERGTFKQSSLKMFLNIFMLAGS